MRIWSCWFLGLTRNVSNEQISVCLHSHHMPNRQNKLYTHVLPQSFYEKTHIVCKTIGFTLLPHLLAIAQYTLVLGGPTQERAWLDLSCFALYDQVDPSLQPRVLSFFKFLSFASLKKSHTSFFMTIKFNFPKPIRYIRIWVSSLWGHTLAFL